MKRINSSLVLFMVLLLVFTLVWSPAPALAEEGDEGIEGGFGWIELADGTVAVTGYAYSSGDVVIPDTLGEMPVTAIADAAFQDCDFLDSITIPEGVTTIGVDAFRSCDSLPSITIPDSVTSIGESAFSRCSYLTSVTLSANLTVIDNYVFSSCERLEEIAIPDNVTTIGAYAFYKCDDLTSVTLSATSNLTAIGESAFGECGLEGITIPDGVTTIGVNAFYDCEDLASVTLPANLISIGYSAFCGCETLESINIPDSVTSIGAGAFSGCYDLASVTLPANLTVIEHSTFAHCGLTGIAIPDSVTTIGASAFYDCLDLASVTLSATSNLTSIGDSVFYNCDLTGITIPDGVTTIGAYAFKYCGDITSVTLPVNLTSIGDEAFAQCDLTGITIPDGVTVIGEYAFSGCDNLASATIYTQTTSFGTNVFSSTDINSDGIYGFAGSTAETYATMNSIPFHPLAAHTVSFDSAGGSPVADVLALDGSVISAPTDPTRSGHTFDGWYKESACTNLWDFATDTVTGDTTLYAGWTINIYPVTFDSQGGSIVPGTTAEYGTGITAPAAPTQTGYTFDGWYKESACTNLWDFATDTVTGDTTLYAGWTINIYPVTFDSQGGSIVPGTTAEHGTGITAPADPTQTGYTFDGWYKESACTNLWDFATDIVTGDTTLYAGWTINTYPVTFDSQGGSIVPGTTAEYGTGITRPPNPTLTGYRFGGWYKESACINPWDFAADTVTIDTTLYAKWTARPRPNANTVTVTYDSQGGSAVPSQTAARYAVIEPPEPPTRAGYAFGGWYMDAACTQVWDLVTGRRDMTVYAKWSPGLTLYMGVRGILAPDTPGGNWGWDSAYLTITENQDGTVTVKGLKSGTTTVTYTLDGVTTEYQVTVLASTLPPTGQNGRPVYILLSLALGAFALAIGSRRNRDRRENIFNALTGSVKD